MDYFEIELYDVEVSYNIRHDGSYVFNGQPDDSSSHRGSHKPGVAVRFDCTDTLAEGATVPVGKIARHCDDHGMTKWRYGDGQWKSSASDAVHSGDMVAFAIQMTEDLNLSDDTDLYEMG